MLIDLFAMIFDEQPRYLRLLMPLER